MVEMHQECVGDIDVIHAVPAGGYTAPLPTIFFYHGNTSSKEAYSYFGYALAQAGFRVILPDAQMHVPVLTAMSNAVYHISGIFCAVILMSFRRLSAPWPHVVSAAGTGFRASFRRADGVAGGL